MRITYDKLPEGRTFPLEREVAKRFVESIAPPSVLSRLVGIHFGANRKTTQEARLVARGETYEIRVNFWIENGRSRILSDKRQWVGAIRRSGGQVDLENEVIVWTPEAAVRYAGFLVAHEIAHAVYADEHFNGLLSKKSGGASEERWCDDWASTAVARIQECLAE